MAAVLEARRESWRRCATTWTRRLPDGVPGPAARRPRRGRVRALRERRGHALAALRLAGTWSRTRSPTCGATCARSTRGGSGRRAPGSRSPTRSGVRCASWATRGGGGTWRGWSRGPAAGAGPAVRGSPRGRSDGGDPGSLASEPDAGVGDLRAVDDPAGVRGGVRGAAGVGAGAAVRRVPDVRRGSAAGPDAEQRAAARERAGAAGDRRASRAVRARAARGRPRRLALDAHGRRVPAAAGGRRGRCSRSRWPWRLHGASSLRPALHSPSRSRPHAAGSA